MHIERIFTMRNHLILHVCSSFFNKTFLIFFTLMILTGCAVGVKQSMPDANSHIKEIQINTLSDKQIKEELKKLHTITKEPYLISTGDRFTYKVYGHPELSIPSIVVLPGGKISVGLAGIVKVEELTVQQANALINTKLSAYIKSPRAVLIPKYIKGAVFTVIGKVRKTGVFSLKSGYKISDALAVAGGFAVGEQDNDTIELADLEHAYIARGNKILPVDFIEAVRKGNYLQNIPLKNGDYIYIPSSMDRQIFVMGEVRLPGNVSYNENQTLLQALAYSKGRMLETASNNVIVVRGNLIKPKVYELNTEDILQGRVPDFRLHPNDILYVPKSTMTEYNDIILKILPTVELLNLMAGPFGNATQLSIPISTSQTKQSN